MVTTRILTRRRASADGGPARLLGRRRRPRTGLAASAPASPAGRLRLSTFGRLYLAAAGVVTLLICYLVLAAQVTQESYEISRLQSQRSELVAEQAQLHYQKASLESPSHVDASANAAGLQRKTPARYVAYQPTALDLAAPIGDLGSVRTALWQRALAGVVSVLAGGREASASDR